MAIDRMALVRRHNPILNNIDAQSPLTVGNGELAFTADITGMQSLYEYYRQEKMPLCTMAQWGWHTTPFSVDKYACTYDDLVETEYDYNGRSVHYPVICAEGNEDVYHWLRQNPHKMNMVRIAIVWRDGDSYTELLPDEISGICQKLHMECGLLESRFRARGIDFTVHTMCAGDYDTLGFMVESEAVAEGKAAVLLAFPYGSPDITGSDWDNDSGHQSLFRYSADIENCIEIVHTLDRDRYLATVVCDGLNEEPDEEAFRVKFVEAKRHHYLLYCNTDKDRISFTVGLGKETADIKKIGHTYGEVKVNSRQYRADFWNRTGVIDLHKSRDKRAVELERRIVLSQYLMAVNCCGSMPPQETGLTCNSWYGKFHMEMYFWHEAYLPLYGRSDLLIKSLDWCLEHIKQARENAAKNGYKGARWPKMVADNAVDSPSKIAPLLVWQQPHIIYMIYLVYRDTKDIEILHKYYEMIAESAVFMADFAVKNEDGFYELRAPLIPVQERHAPQITRNPVFEVEYFVVALKIAISFAEMLGKDVDAKWRDVAENMISSPIENGYYPAHSDCHDTYENFAKDHPSMLMAYGVIDSGRMNEKAMEKSLQMVQRTWNYQSLWGWDFAVMAMTATRLGKPDLAIELLLTDTYKNVYVKSGNNRQVSRDDLPLYLPGNGSLLLAVAMMAAGFDGCEENLPGFPKDGKWTVEYEGIKKAP